MNLKKKNKFRISNKNKNIYRLLIHKTIKNIYARIISPYPKNEILETISTVNKNIRKILISKNINTGGNIKAAKLIGKIVYEKCIKYDFLLKNMIIDISGFRYHGRIKALSEELKKKNILKENKNYNEH